MALSVTASWIAAFVPGVGQVVAGGGGGDTTAATVGMVDRQHGCGGGVGGALPVSRVAEARSLFASYDHAPAGSPDDRNGEGERQLPLARRTCRRAAARNIVTSAGGAVPPVLEDARFSADVQFSVDEEGGAAVEPYVELPSVFFRYPDIPAVRAGSEGLWKSWI